MPWPKTSGAATCKRCAHPCLCNNLFNTKLLALDLAWHWHINELLLEHRMAEQGLQQGEPVGSCQSLQQSFAQYRKKRLQRRVRGRDAQQVAKHRRGSLFPNKVAAVFSSEFKFSLSWPYHHPAACCIPG